MRKKNSFNIFDKDKLTKLSSDWPRYFTDQIESTSKINDLLKYFTFGRFTFGRYRVWTPLHFHFYLYYCSSTRITTSELCFTTSTRGGGYDRLSRLCACCCCTCLFDLFIFSRTSCVCVQKVLDNWMRATESCVRNQGLLLHKKLVYKYSLDSLALFAKSKNKLLFTAFY